MPELRALLRAHLKETADSIGQDIENLFDVPIRRVLLDGLDRVGAHEGTVWLLDEARESLVPKFNSGPRAADFVGQFRQSLRSGMISMVVATEQPICENDVHRNRQQDRSLDSALALRTCAMLAVPFYFAGELRGVISAVQLKAAESTEPDPAGFAMDHLAHLQRTAALLSRLVEHRIFTHLIGVEFRG